MWSPTDYGRPDAFHRGDERIPEICAVVPKLGTIDDLVEFARRTRVGLVIFSLPISAERRILQILKKLWVLPVDIRLSAHTNTLHYRSRSYSYVGDVPLLDPGHCSLPVA